MTAPAHDHAHPGIDRLAHFPVSFFAIVMGLGGLTLALRAAETGYGLDPGASAALRAATITAFLVIAGVYAVKLFTRFAAVRAEWDHPVRIAFFPTASIGLLLIATSLAPDAPDLARGLWLIGAGAQALLTLSVLSSWIGHRRFEHAHLNPAWFIPAVGNVLAPVAGAQLGFIELSWLFFSAGMVFWIILMTLVFNRLVFHDPLPGRFVPTLVILMAPPAVAFIAWVKLGGAIDPFARILLNAGYVFGAVVATQAPKLVRLDFAMSWWALSFPVAALSVASFLFAERASSAIHAGIGTGLLALLSALVAGLALRTALAVWRGELCRPE